MDASEVELDEAVSKVTTLVGAATIETLEEAFGEIQLQIPPSAAGKKSLLLRTLNRHLNSDIVVQEDDQGLAVMKQVISVCERGVLKDVATGGGGSGTGSKSIVKPDPDNSAKVSAQTSSVNATVASLNVSKLKDFKLNGMVGGDKPIPYSSLVFQIENAQNSGFEDGTICAGVLKATAPGYLRTYLELKKDLTVESLLELLKVNFAAKCSGTLFTELCKCTQKEDQDVGSFALELFVLRERIIELGEEEQCPYERPFLQRHLLRALSVGIRDNNIRFDLKEVFANREATDEELLKAITESVNREKERLSRLSLSTPVTVASTSAKSQSPAEAKSLDNKRKRENQMQIQINELQVKSERQEKKLAEMEEQSTKRHAEIMAVLSNNANVNQIQGGSGVADPPRRKVWRCQNCYDNKIMRCNHCFKCCQSGHQIADCPEEN